MKRFGLLFAVTWIGLWLTSDQQGQRHFKRGEFAEAAAAFQDPMWRGTSWYRAGEFEKAAQEFARLATPEANYNEGNAWLMRGKYDQAIASYERALGKRPAWNEARDNRNLAIARKKRIDQQGGDAGDQRLGADEVVFDQNKPPGGQDTVIAGQQATSDAAVQALWLRRVQTKPADFLKAKFAFQHGMDSEGDGE